MIPYKSTFRSTTTKPIQIQTVMKTKDTSGQMIRMIIAELEKALEHGVAKHGQEKGKRGELSSLEFVCVEGCFERAFGAGLDHRTGNVDVIDALTRLVNCKNEKRAHQFTIAFCNEVLRLKNPGRFQDMLRFNIKRFSETTRPQIMTSGVEHLIEYLEGRMRRRAA